MQVVEELRAHRGDTTTIEVKRAAGGTPQVGQTLSAFANLPGGGTIICGLDAKDGFAATGVADPARLEAGIAGQAREAVQPSPEVHFQTFTLDERTVVVAHVIPLRAADKPAIFAGRAYLRQADGVYVMQEHELRMLEVDKLHADQSVPYDATPVFAGTAEDFDPILLRQYLASVRDNQRRLRDQPDEDILRKNSVVRPDGTPTLAGYYALGDFPQGKYPALKVTAAVQLTSRTGGPRNENLEDFDGPLPALLDGVMRWVRDNLRSIRTYREDGHIVEVAEIPLNAVREVVANALVHRDLGPNTLGLGKSIQVRLTEKSLMVLSPGGLRGVSIEQLESEEHAQAAVNQRLYNIAKRLTLADGAQLIEGEGGGIQEVFRSTARAGLPRPHLIDTGVQFKVLLFRPERTRQGETDLEPPTPDARYGATSRGGEARPPRGGKNAQAVVEALSHTPNLVFRQIVDATGLTVGQARYAINGLLETGTVQMVGSQGDRRTYYRLADTAGE